MTRYGYGRVTVDGRLWRCDAPSTGGSSRYSRHWVHEASAGLIITVSGDVDSPDWTRVVRYRGGDTRTRSQAHVEFACDDTVEAVLGRAWRAESARVYGVHDRAGDSTADRDRDEPS